MRETSTECQHEGLCTACKVGKMLTSTLLGGGYPFIQREKIDKKLTPSLANLQPTNVQWLLLRGGRAAKLSINNVVEQGFYVRRRGEDLNPRSRKRKSGSPTRTVPSPFTSNPAPPGGSHIFSKNHCRGAGDTPETSVWTSKMCANFHQKGGDRGL